MKRALAILVLLFPVHIFAASESRAQTAFQSAMDGLAGADAGKLGQALSYFELHPDPKAVPGLVALLGRDDAKVKKAALRTLGFSGDLKAAPSIVPFLADAEPSLRLSAVFALMRMRALGDLGNAHGLEQDADPLVRLAVAGAKTLFGLDDRRADLLKALDGTEIGPVSVAAPALVLIGRPEDIQAVAGLLRHHQDESRQIGAQALQDARDGGPTLVGELIEALGRETYFYVQQAMIRTAVFQGMKDPKGFAPLLIASPQSSALMAEAALYGEFPKLEEMLASQLRPEAPDYKDRLKLLEAAGGPNALEAIRRAALDGKAAPEGRYEALLSLGRMGDTASLASLRTLTRSGPTQVRAGACVALAMLKDTASIPQFLALLKDAESAVRLGALRAVNRMELFQAKETVDAMRNDPDPAVRQLAGRVLESLKSKEAAMNDPIYRLGHDAFLIQAGGKNIYFDPFQLPAGLPKADLVFITHDHYDHLSPDDIKKIATEKTELVLPKAFADKAAGLPGKVTTIAAGGTATVAGVEVRAVPAYNPAKKFHPKGYGGLGYFVKIGGTTYYHAGDTDLIPEMKDFPAADVCFLPVSGTYVMTAAEAAEATKILKCKKAIPMHYGAIIGADGDAEAFKRLASCPVEILQKTEKVP